MADVLYFAYGSNMLRERLAKRCPGIVPAGLATLPHHRLTFDKVSADGSGKGAFEPVQGEQLFGVLWTLPEADLPALDRAEGVGHGYERFHSVVVREGGEAVRALTYRATDRRSGLRPYVWYLDLVIAGTMQHGLAEGQIWMLRAISFEVDAELDRPGRVEALQELKQAGYVGATR